MPTKWKSSLRSQVSGGRAGVDAFQCLTLLIITFFPALILIRRIFQMSVWSHRQKITFKAASRVESPRKRKKKLQLDYNLYSFFALMHINYSSFSVFFRRLEIRPPRRWSRQSRRRWRELDTHRFSTKLMQCREKFWMFKTQHFQLNEDRFDLRKCWLSGRIA